MAYRDAPLQMLVVDDRPQGWNGLPTLSPGPAGGIYDVWEAETEADGLIVCQTQPPNFVLLDYRLPALDGVGEPTGHVHPWKAVPRTLPKQLAYHPLLVIADRKSAAKIPASMACASCCRWMNPHRTNCGLVSKGSRFRKLSSSASFSPKRSPKIFRRAGTGRQQNTAHTNPGKTTGIEGIENDPYLTEPFSLSIFPMKRTHSPAIKGKGLKICVFQVMIEPDADWRPAP
jgi:hypothetical protein